jgi:hypothetical protein
VSVDHSYYWMEAASKAELDAIGYRSALPEPPESIDMVRPLANELVADFAEEFSSRLDDVGSW